METGENNVFETIRERYDSIFEAEKKVADYILEYPEKAVDYNVSELADVSGVSDATVIRMCKHIGYQGYYQLRLQLSRDIGKLHQEQTEDRKESKSSLEMAFGEAAHRIQQIGENNKEETFLQAAAMLRECRRVHIIAVGNTAPVGMYFGYRLEHMGIRCDYNELPEYFMNHINLAEEGDIVFAISKSGSSRQIIQAMELAGERKIPVIAVTGERQSPVSRYANCILTSSYREKGQKGHFRYENNYEHLSEMAVIDILLVIFEKQYGLARREQDSISRTEMIFSEYKL